MILGFFLSASFFLKVSACYKQVEIGQLGMPHQSLMIVVGIYISVTIELELGANYVSGQTDLTLFPLSVFTVGNDTTVCQKLTLSPDTLLNNVY